MHCIKITNKSKKNGEEGNIKKIDILDGFIELRSNEKIYSSSC